MGFKLKLSTKLKCYRSDRPDEWTMDEFFRDAESLEKQLQEALNIPPVIQSDYLCDRECSGENKCDEQCYMCVDMEKHSV